MTDCHTPQRTVKAQHWSDAVAQIVKGRTSGGKAEHTGLDFKTQKPDDKASYQDLTDAVVCFVNAAGGTIVVGVSDQGTGPSAIVGTTLAVDAIRLAVYERTEPALTVCVSESSYEGLRLVVIDVPEGAVVHSTTKGHFSRRVGTQCLPMRPAEVARLEEERAHRDWSADPSDRTPAEVSERAMVVMYDLLRGSGRNTQARLARLTQLELLSELGLLRDDGRLTHAGDLLLCPPTSGGAPDLLVYQYRLTRSGEAIAVRRWQQPLITAHREALETIQARLSTIPITTRSGQQILVEDFPREAIREALTNALVHGDLRDHRTVQIEHSPELLSLMSPGPLVAGVTPENLLTHGSRPRFVSLARIMTTLTLTETLGQGFDRMFREMVRSGRSVPNVTESLENGGSTLVEFVGGPANLRLAGFVAELPESERDDTDALLITHMLCERRTVNAALVAPVIQRPPTQAQDVLRRLAMGDAAMLESTPGTTGRTHPNYRFRSHALAALGPSVAYNRRTTSETDKKIIGHVREYEWVNSATIQRIFDVDVYQARDILRDLVGREILIRISEQTRGTAVKYGEGPRFPKAEARHRKPLIESAIDALFES